MIKLGVKGLAKFMTASAVGQRKILRDYKYPEEEGTAQAAYYRDARDLVAEFHRNGHPAEWLKKKAELLFTAASAVGGRVGTRLRNNSRGLSDYAAGFPSKAFEVLPEKKFFVAFGDVRVSVLPDLHVREDDHERFIKLEFAKDAPDSEMIKIVSQVMFEAAAAAKLPVSSSDVLYIDVARRKAHRGARIGSRMRREIDAACANIAAVWDSIEP